MRGVVLLPQPVMARTAARLPAIAPQRRAAARTAAGGNRLMRAIGKRVSLLAIYSGFIGLGLRQTPVFGGELSARDAGVKPEIRHLAERHC